MTSVPEALVKFLEHPVALLIIELHPPNPFVNRLMTYKARVIFTCFCADELWAHCFL